MSFADVLQRLWPGDWYGRGQGVPDMKASATARLVRVEMLGEPVWSPRDYGAFAREGFMQNAICYRSVRMIAEAAASIPLLLYERGFEVSEHPFLDLMRSPSHDHTGTDFLESWYGFLLVSGNAYVEAVALDGQLRELHALRPDRMKVIAGPDGWPAGYEYTADGRSVTFEHEPVPGVRPILHMRLFHPVNDHYGMSPIEAAARAIDIHNAASSWNKALLDNAARPSGALVYGKGGEHLTGAQFERLKGELEASFQGARNAGRPMLLEGGLDWKPLSLTPKDMDFIEARNAAAREIALAIGVPPMLLGIPGDNTYSNYQEASRAFWRQTVLPLVARTCRSLSAWLSPAFSPSSASGNGSGGLELKPDLDQVDALSSERDALWSRLEKATFLTANEKRAEAGYDPVSGGDELKRRPPILDLTRRFNPYHDELGRFTDAEGDVYGRTPDGTPVDPAQASGGYPINLLEEDALGGHTYDRHINKSEEYLKARITGSRVNVPLIGGFGEKRAGSFTSLEAAEKLVNSTISENKDKVEAFAKGSFPFNLPILYITKEFSEPTGYEAYAPDPDTPPSMRSTNKVQVKLRRTSSSPKGYYVGSAYPLNED